MLEHLIEPRGMIKLRKKESEIKKVRISNTTKATEDPAVPIGTIETADTSVTLNRSTYSFTTGSVETIVPKDVIDNSKGYDVSYYTIGTGESRKIYAYISLGVLLKAKANVIEIPYQFKHRPGMHFLGSDRKEIGELNKLIKYIKSIPWKSKVDVDVLMLKF